MFKLNHFFSSKFKIKKSKIHSKGAFAKKNIKKGEIIAEYYGKKISKKQSENLYEEMIENHKKDPSKASVYTFDLDDNYDLNGNVWWNLAKYINHSCDPNCESETITKNKESKIVIKAIKNIKKGNEINFNYGYDVTNWKDHPCYCGSKNCVGYIVCEKQWPKLKKLKSKLK